MPEPLVYIRNREHPQSQAHLPLHDAGFVMGATVTDLCRTFHHHLFRLGDHSARFVESCRLACIPMRHSANDVSRIASELADYNAKLIDASQDLALVMCATPGPVAHYLGEIQPQGGIEPTLLMHTFPIPVDRYAHFFEQGVRLVTPSIRQVPAASIDRRIKHRSRLHWWLAEQEVRQVDAAAVALLLDESGAVTETAAASFLIVKDGTVISPPTESVLPGISLRTTREFCGELGIPFREQRLTLDDCRDADEALLVGTSFCVAGVRFVNGQSIHWPGKIYERLLTKWSAAVGLDIRRQFLPNR